MGETQNNLESASGGGISVPSDGFDEFWTMLSAIGHVTADLYDLREQRLREKPNKPQRSEGTQVLHTDLRETFTSIHPGLPTKTRGTYLRGPDDAHSKQQCGQRAHSGFKREAATERDKKV